MIQIKQKLQQGREKAENLKLQGANLKSGTHYNGNIENDFDWDDLEPELTKKIHQEDTAKFYTRQPSRPLAQSVQKGNDQTNIYILKLEQGKYYIGKAHNPIERYREHLNGCGSSWTQKYPPISLEEVIPNASPFDEDKYTKIYMEKYGIDNVRGGTYVSEVLDDIQLENLKKEIWGAKDKCTRCGRSTHFVKDCYAKTDVYGNPIDQSEKYEEVWVCQTCNGEFSTQAQCLNHEKFCKPANQQDWNRDNCHRCGRSSHVAKDCFAKTDINGNPITRADSYQEIEEKWVDGKRDRGFSNQAQGLNHVRFCNTESQKDRGNGGACYRCGRTSHFARDCYATTDIKGFRIDSEDGYSVSSDSSY